jgi:predicted nucleotidyltransferase
VIPALLPRDFVETCDGLIFAVVDATPDEGKILCFLRYVRGGDPQRLIKLDSDEALTLLTDRFPCYLHRSIRHDALLHGVEAARIRCCYRAAQRSIDVLSENPKDPMEARLRRLLGYFVSRGISASDLGVTGSLLIGAQTARSDFDLVAYTRTAFGAARLIVTEGVRSGAFDALDERAWHDAWSRRGCSLSLEQYIWHERRKANKALFEGTKFDLALVLRDRLSNPIPVRKLGRLRLRARVLDDSGAYDHPARYLLDHGEVSEILVFPHTYVGQAVRGETVEAAGYLEEDASGQRRLIIGSSREAPGEYLRVCRSVA